MRALKKDSKANWRKAQTRLAIIAACCVSAILLMGGAYLFLASEGGPVTTAGEYSVTSPVAGTYSSVIECEGTVEPIRTVDVHARVKGTVTSLKVKDGDYVSQGNVLFEILDEKGETQRVSAEIPGTIAKVQVAEGMNSSQLENLDYAMQIADMNVLVGVVSAPEYAVPFVEVGEWASVFENSKKDMEYDGMVLDLSKSGTVDAQGSGQATYRVTLLLNDADDLSIGSAITAHIPINDYGQVYYVPSTAVREVDGLVYIEVIRAGGTVEQHQVELLGTSQDGEKIIKGGALTSESQIRADLGE